MASTRKKAPRATAGRAPPVLFVGLRLDEEDAATLDRLVRAEKLTRSDILRRALRAYGEKR